MPIDPLSAAATLRRHALLTGAGAVALALGSAAGHAQDGLYEFISPPSTSSNAVYRLNSETGEIQGCIYERVEGRAIGQTVCYAPGSGAEAPGGGLYALHASNLEKESGVVRVNLATGGVAFCWIDFKGEQTVCTEQVE